MTSAAKLNAKIATQMIAATTDALIEISTRLNLVSTMESILICTLAERELERRISPEAFGDHLAAMNQMFDLAATQPTPTGAN